MFDEILVCLDGSPVAENILPLAQQIALAKKARVILLRLVGDSNELSVEENYMRERSRLFRANQVCGLIRPGDGYPWRTREESPGDCGHDHAWAISLGRGVVRKRGAESDSRREAAGVAPSSAAR
jgi:hypothetical protein